MADGTVLKVSKTAAALGTLILEPDLKDAEIAERVGCHPKSLRRMPGYKKLRALLQAQAKEDLPRGYRFVDRDGHRPTTCLEAFAHDQDNEAED